MIFNKPIKILGRKTDLMLLILCCAFTAFIVTNTMCSCMVKGKSCDKSCDKNADKDVENVNTMEPNMNVDSVSGVDNDVFNAQPSEV